MRQLSRFRLFRRSRQRPHPFLSPPPKPSRSHPRRQLGQAVRFWIFRPLVALRPTSARLPPELGKHGHDRAGTTIAVVDAKAGAEDDGIPLPCRPAKCVSKTSRSSWIIASFFGLLCLILDLPPSSACQYQSDWRRLLLLGGAGGREEEGDGEMSMGGGDDGEFFQGHHFSFLLLPALTDIPPTRRQRGGWGMAIWQHWEFGGINGWVSLSLF